MHEIELQPNEASQKGSANSRSYSRGTSGEMAPLKEIPTGEIQVKNLLGKGQFGEVYKGDWMGSEVAMKKLNSVEMMKDFVREAQMLSTANHPNIVRLLGVHTSRTGEQYIVTEFVSKGCLLNVLQQEKSFITLPEMISMAINIASGMRYLEANKIVHRDLAARNILVEVPYVAKISDLGLSREDDYAKPGDDSKVPIRWCAPEILTKRRYSTQSDVWAFGITVWEMLKYGAMPYAGKSNTEVIEFVCNGGYPSQPDNCPNDLWAILVPCWSKNPAERPTFEFIFKQLKRFLATDVNHTPAEDAYVSVLYAKTPQVAV